MFSSWKAKRRCRSGHKCILSPRLRVGQTSTFRLKFAASHKEVGVNYKLAELPGLPIATST